ncbi:MAG TPA: hypothetical protein VN047_05840 [Sphingopyxis sp.]|nr:hypothetical protein [Sphingopyxis sp.]
MGALTGGARLLGSARGARGAQTTVTVLVGQHVRHVDVVGHQHAP